MIDPKTKEEFPEIYFEFSMVYFNWSWVINRNLSLFPAKNIVDLN